jgi:type IV pilus assembly protein PilA
VYVARKPEAGFTLVELMIVVAIVGVLAVLAVYGVRKYLANAKSVEARNALGQIAKDASTAEAAANAFCPNAPMVPSDLASVQGKKYQSTKADWNQAGWRCLMFSLEMPQYYAYSYTTVTTDGNSGGFTAYAYGDLDGNGIYSTFSVVGQAHNGPVAISPNVLETSPDE